MPYADTLTPVDILLRSIVFAISPLPPCRAAHAAPPLFADLLRYAAFLLLRLMPFSRFSLCFLYADIRAMLSSLLPPFFDFFFFHYTLAAIFSDAAAAMPLLF